MTGPAMVVLIQGYGQQQTPEARLRSYCDTRGRGRDVYAVAEDYSLFLRHDASAKLYLAAFGLIERLIARVSVRCLDNIL